MVPISPRGHLRNLTPRSVFHWRASDGTRRWEAESMHDTTLTAQRREAMHRDGFVLLSGVLEPARIAELREAIDRLTPIGLDYQGMLDDHYKCVFNRSPFWLQFLDLPEVIERSEERRVGT